MRILRTQHSIYQEVHFFFDELTAVGLLNPLTHGGPKAGIFLDQTQNRFLHRLQGNGGLARKTRSPFFQYRHLELFFAAIPNHFAPPTAGSRWIAFYV